MQKCVQEQQEVPETLMRKPDHRLQMLAIAVKVLGSDSENITSNNFEQAFPCFLISVLLKIGQANH